MLAEYLGSSVEKESAKERITRQRAEVFEDFGLVAAYLSLGEGQAPTQTQYANLVDELGLRHAPSAVAELWNGRWRQATREFTGHARYENEQMRAVLQRAHRAARADPERQDEYALDCLRRWLETDPPMRRAAAYGRWVNRENDAGAEPPPYTLGTLRENLSIDFHAAIAVAEGRQTLAEARAERDHRVQTEISPLIERAELSQLLDMNVNQVKRLASQGRLPPAIFFNVHRAVWLREDIEAFREGRAVPSRDLAAERRKWLDTRELAELLGIPRHSVLYRTEREAWHQIPRPTYHRISMLLWRRDAVESWLEEQRQID